MLKPGYQWLAAALTAMFATCAAGAQADASPEPAQVQSKIIGNAHGQVETLIQGRGPVIVILPSLGRSATDYDQVAVYLAAEGFRVIRPFPRGSGQSRGAMTGVTLHDFAGDVAAVMDQEKTGPAIVVGHAWGSQPARMLAVERPDLVKALVLAAASVGKFPPGSKEKSYGRLVEAINGSGDPTLPEAQRLSYLQQAFFAPGHDARVWLSGWFPATHHAQAEARDHTPIDSYYYGGNVPILDLRAQYDTVVIPHVLKALLGTRVTEGEIANAGHAMAPEQPLAMSKAIAAYARQIYQTK